MNASAALHVRVRHESPLVQAGMASTLTADPRLQVQVCSAEAPWPPGPCEVFVAGYAAALQCLQAAPASPAGPPQLRPRVLIVASQASEWEVRHALERGAHGFLLLDCSPEQLLQGVHMVARGARCFDPLVTERIAASLVRTSLTQREYDVLQRVVAGWGNKAIASQLDIALGTVKAHVKAILEKLHVQTRMQAAAVAAERGMLRVPLPAEHGRGRNGTHGSPPPATRAARHTSDTHNDMDMRR